MIRVIKISLLASRAAVTGYTTKSTWETVGNGLKTNTASVTGMGSKTTYVTIKFSDSGSIRNSLYRELTHCFKTTETQNVVTKTVCQNGEPVENLPGVKMGQGGLATGVVVEMEEYT